MIELLHSFAVDCPKPNFLGFPTWYEYLPMVKDPNNGICSPQLTSINNLWAIVAAIVSILLRVAALLAVGFIIYGGFQYVTSQGNSEATGKARGTIMNALIGLLLAVSAAAIVQFVAGRF